MRRKSIRILVSDLQLWRRNEKREPELPECSVCLSVTLQQKHKRNPSAFIQNLPRWSLSWKICQAHCGLPGLSASPSFPCSERPNNLNDNRDCAYYSHNNFPVNEAPSPQPALSYLSQTSPKAERNLSLVIKPTAEHFQGISLLSSSLPQRVLPEVAFSTAWGSNSKVNCLRLRYRNALIIIIF